MGAVLHVQYCSTPQSNSPPDCVLSVGRPDGQAALRLESRIANSEELESSYHCVSDETMKVVGTARAVLHP